MAKIVRHDFSSIHDALNKMIIAELKAALGLLPGKRMRWNGEVPLCHVILSPDEAYIPRDVHVTEAGIDEEHGGLLYITGFNDGSVSHTAINWFEDETDWHDVTDFGHLIDMIACSRDLLTAADDQVYNLPNMSVIVCGYVPEMSLRQAVERTVTI